jgi:phosphatidylglycerol:prolipoprotein diacylglycerol transferase
MFLHTFHPTSTLLAVGGIQLRWYGALMAAAVAVGWMLAQVRMRGRIASQQLADLFVWLVVAGFIGARLYHVLNEPAYYAAHPLEIFAVWNGGLAIHGALAFGAAAAWVWSRRRRIPFGWLLDRLAPAVALGQAIGRWGNYFNQELFGRPTDLPWGIPIDPANRPAAFVDSTYFHPTFLYESLGDLVIVAGLLFLDRRWPRRPAGSLTLVYFAATAAVRLSTEFLRIDRVPVILGARLPLLTSGAILVAALAVLIVRHARPPASVRP